MIASENNETPRRWCILRTSGQRTVKLAQSLTGSGIEAWTPTQMQNHRRPRSTERRLREVPIAATFVFVRADYLRELVTISRALVSPHPGFSFFRDIGRAGQIALVDDIEIDNLRDQEFRARIKVAKVRRHSFETGDRVRVTSGIATGLIGTVVKPKGKYPLINIGGGNEMKIAAWILEADVTLPPSHFERAAVMAANS